MSRSTTRKRCKLLGHVNYITFSAQEFSDAEFDSYWEFEAKNKNRNRIRVGRQYQATVPPLLKSGEKDTRECADLETLKWKPDQISEQDIDAYLSMAKAISSYARTIENYRGLEKPPENSLQTAIKGLTEFVTSHHPCHRDAGCKVPVSDSSSSSSPSEASSSKSNVSDWTPPETRLFLQALETCGKNFCAIKKEFLPWKPVRSLIEYYYYFNGKGEKNESPIPKLSSPISELPFDSSICKVEKTEPDENCCQDVDMTVNPYTKEEQSLRDVVKEEPELQATPASTSEEKKLTECREPSLPRSIDHESNIVQSTVGSLKFFLGGRLVLKLNAQQEGSSGKKCQWVQSHDTPRYGHQSKKMRHRKKSIQDTLPQVPTSPKLKKKHKEDANANHESSTPKKLKLKSPLTEAFPLLCSSSWTPPVADGQDAAELDDASSKTSEGHDSQHVSASRGLKTEGLFEVKRLDATSDIQDLKHDKKPPWPLIDPVPSTSSDVYEEYSSRGSSFTSEKISPDISYSHEVLNHKSALTPVKTQIKGSNSQPRAAHSGSPNAKLFAKWPCASLDSEKPKSLPFFHSPNSLCCHPSPESSSREFVLDLSSKSGYCKAQDSRVSQEPCCSVYPNECTENCSSSEESAHNDSSPCCAKSSNLVAYRRDTPVPGTETSKSDQKSLTQTSRDSDCEENQVSRTASDGVNECSGQCLCCYNPSTSCASPKCCKSYSSKEHVCNKEDCNPGDSPNSLMSSATDMFSTKQHPWYGSSVAPMLQIYPQCYPYYVAYDVNQPANVSTVETPLDLTSSEPAKSDNSLPNTLPEIGVDVPTNAAEAMDRGMLYQLLKNKVNK